MVLTVPMMVAVAVAAVAATAEMKTAAVHAGLRARRRAVAAATVG